MKLKALLILLIMSTLCSCMLAESRPIRTTGVETSFTLDSLDYQLIVDTVNARSMNTHLYPITSENYYGASSYYINFDARDGKYAASFTTAEAAIEEALGSVLLPAKYPNPALNDLFRVAYRAFSGSMAIDTMRFYCSSISPLRFMLIVPHTEQMTMDSLDYQSIVNYVNANLVNTNSYPTTAENYFGASAYYKNFDMRAGAYNDIFSIAQEAIAEALSTVLLPVQYPAAYEKDTFVVNYNTYDGESSNDSMTFVCTDKNPLTFVSIAAEESSDLESYSTFDTIMDSLDYQSIVNYVNTHFVNTNKRPTVAENYFGASAYYQNFDIRVGAYNDTFSIAQEAIAEALSTVLLPASYPSAYEKDTFVVHFNTYDGGDSNDSMTFVCTDEDPLIFVSTVVKNLFVNLTFGTDSTFDVVTWNIEHFPKSGEVTMSKVRDIIRAMDPEVIAFQEIDDTTKFRQMVDGLDNYEPLIGAHSFASMCFIYKKDSVTVNGTELLFEDDLSSFPRSPFVLDCSYRGEQFIVVTNHLKCCGDGVLDINNSNDEENRRLNAISSLRNYIDNNWPDKNVIVVGDYNDVLEDEAENNVFMPFINDFTHYRFADMSTSLGDGADFSYPSWPCDLDHILITNELFVRSTSATIMIDDHIGWTAYDADISDHRPVGLRVVMDKTLVPPAGPKNTVITMQTSDYQLIVDYVNDSLENTDTHPTNTENYFGASAFYTNFDGRSGSYKSSFSNYDEAIEEALLMVTIPAKLETASMNDRVVIYYTLFTGTASQDSMIFYCTSEDPLSFSLGIATGLLPQKQRAFSISPNPVESWCTIEGLDLSAQQELRLYNTKGQLLMQQLLNGNPSISLDMSAYPAGLYLLSVSGYNENYIQKIVKK